MWHQYHFTHTERDRHTVWQQKQQQLCCTNHECERMHESSRNYVLCAAVVGFCFSNRIQILYIYYSSRSGSTCFVRLTNVLCFCWPPVCVCGSVYIPLSPFLCVHSSRSLSFSPRPSTIHFYVYVCVCALFDCYHCWGLQCLHSSQRPIHVHYRRTNIHVQWRKINEHEETTKQLEIMI